MPQARQSVHFQAWAQPGQMPPVQKVFHTVPQFGVQAQRLSGLGRHSHLGQ